MATHSYNSKGIVFPIKDIAGKEIYWSKGQYQVPLKPRSLNKFRNSIIYSAEGFIQKKNGQFLRDTYWWDEAITEYQLLRNWRTLFCKPLKGNWFSMILYFSWGYYHWFCDILPRLYKVQDLLPSDTRFIIHKNPPFWKRKSLELMNIPLSLCYEFDGKIPLKLENLYFMPPVAMTGDHDPEALQWVRNQMLQRSGIGTVTIPSLRLYVSRSAARCRRIVNERELMERLEPLGFKLVQAEKLALEEQIKLFSQAEWIIGPHGAGLTNMLYAPTGAKVIELFEPSILRRCYYQMSKSLNHIHHIAVGHQRHNLGAEPNIYLTNKNIEDIIHLIKNYHNSK
ncbi:MULTISPECIES: glycosyltransferase family 61 protein [unclassified Moorena]|uniref:glycosyltransferase family 61 protein n=1 Tax=unclassified Moorena TaxID=2683338 RepID=UPI0014012E78|nr:MULTISPECIES: glycosyltransferase family 61 protein [unclassified Moorena]NEO15302.1 glycosyltransferase family 61 protein [Moorena sp. SIO3E8]NEQ01704.1 glycosyltransferase family 61 protein [Moorena sp. SIO3F7]